MNGYILNTGAFSADVRDKIEVSLGITDMDKLDQASKESGVQEDAIYAATFANTVITLGLSDFIDLANWMGKNPADYIQQVQPAKLW